MATTPSSVPSSSGAEAQPLATGPPQLALLDYFFPGFSMMSGAIQKYAHIDLNVYIPWFLLVGGMVVFWQYFSEYYWAQLESHFMSTVDVRTDDEAYNMLMGWVAAQRFSQGARRFIVNTNLNSRSWFLWRSSDNDEEEEEGEENANTAEPKKRGFSYTPTFGSHYFWYKGRILIFRRNQNRDQNSFMVVSEREEISICCFGRDPRILKELLIEARQQYLKRDERKTLIYRGTTRAGSTEPTWQRCLARNSRPLSTVILNEKVKQDLIQDVTDYLNPNTRRWYSNRGIPYKRGYLLYGPAGCGKSSMALALAGHFEKMRIYIISLNSVTASEENLASLFAELPRRCVVLLEDIDTAGLTHTRDELKPAVVSASDDVVPGQVTPGVPVVNNQPSGRLSLSGLLNILDGVASQEGRILIMTTNHLEKLDKALIRPGRVDMIIKFDRADKGMIAAIFKAIFAPLEGDEAPTPLSAADKAALDPEAQKRRAEEEAKKREKVVARVGVLAEEFAEKVPAHEFSPAELQGYLLKKKADAAGAVAGVEEWVAETRKDRKEKELKEAEDKRKAEEEAEKKKKSEEEEEAKKKKEEEETKEKEEKKKLRKEKKKKRDAKKKRKERRAAKKDESSSESSSDSSSSSDSESGSASEAEPAPSKKEKKEKKKPVEAAKAPEVESVAEKVVEAVTAKKVEGDGLVKAEEGKTGADSGYGTP